MRNQAIQFSVRIAGILLGASVLAALLIFSSWMDRSINRALPDLSLIDRSDVETAAILYLPEVLLEPVFDRTVSVIHYPYAPGKSDWQQRMARQIRKVQRVQGVPILGGVAPVVQPEQLKPGSLDQFGKAIDIGLMGRERNEESARMIQSLFAEAYGDYAAAKASGQGSIS